MLPVCLHPGPKGSSGATELIAVSHTVLTLSPTAALLPAVLGAQIPHLTSGVIHGSTDLCEKELCALLRTDPIVC